MVLAAPGTLAIAQLRTEGGLALSRAEMAAFNYLSNSTAADAVVVHNAYHSPVVSAFSGRRVVFERFGDYYPERREAVERLYSTRDTAEALAILRRYEVDYLIEYRNAPVHFDKSALHLAFEEGEVRVFEVRLP
jgi:hypothetical protein